jgi:DinB superfamily
MASRHCDASALDRLAAACCVAYVQRQATVFMSDDYIHENAMERARLFSLTARLTESELTQPLPNGWSVATKLLHLAFWDRYCAALLKRWRNDIPSISSLDVDAVNEAVRVLSVAVPATDVVPLVRAAAEEADREAEQIAPELRAAIEGAGRERVLRRSLHRRAHLDQIEEALKG